MHLPSVLIAVQILYICTNKRVLFQAASQHSNRVPDGSKETLLSMHKKLSARKFCPATQTRLAWSCDAGVRSVGRSATTRGSRRAQTV